MILDKHLPTETALPVGLRRQEIDQANPTAISESAVAATFTSVDRRRLIEEAAFYHAERRGFVRGHELLDWLRAEHEVNAACGLIEPEPRWDAT